MISNMEPNYKEKEKVWHKYMFIEIIFIENTCTHGTKNMKNCIYMGETKQLLSTPKLYFVMSAVIPKGTRIIELQV